MALELELALWAAAVDGLDEDALAAVLRVVGIDFDVDVEDALALLEEMREAHGASAKAIDARIADIAAVLDEPARRRAFRAMVACAAAGGELSDAAVRFLGKSQAALGIDGDVIAEVLA